RYAEIVIGYLVLAVAAVHARRPLILAGIVAAAVASLVWPAYHFVVLAHLHNVVPLVFLWEWGRRTGFRAVQVGWVLVVPALILAGAADPWIGGTDDRFVAVSAPPGAVGTVMGARFLVVFAFLQTMHYVVWVWFLPRHAPDAVQAFENRVPVLTNRRVWAL